MGRLTSNARREGGINGPESGLGKEEGHVGAELDPLPERGVHVKGGVDEAGEGLEIQRVDVVGLVREDVPVELDAGGGEQSFVDVGQVDGPAMVGAPDVKVLQLVRELAFSIEVVRKELSL